jgi:hypothetical protein
MAMAFCENSLAMARFEKMDPDSE